jgi:CDP-diacylglycerol--glycerol-3-phosphate 3-phosphatidyltransferase
MTLANRLTVARLYLTVGFVAVLSAPVPFAATIALFLFLLAGVTDYLDGWVARRFNQASDFGRLMDPLVDKIMTASAFICLTASAALPAWFTITIISREFLITGLRLLAASKGVVLAAERLGKHKTAWQIGTIIYYLVAMAVAEFPGTAKNATVLLMADPLLLAVTLGFTLYSGFGYLARHRDLLRD